MVYVTLCQHVRSWVVAFYSEFYSQVAIKNDISVGYIISNQVFIYVGLYIICVCVCACVTIGEWDLRKGVIWSRK